MTVEQRPAPPATSAPSIVVGTTFSLGVVSVGRILAMAAAAPAGSEDPVDRACATALLAERPDIPVPIVDEEDLDPARIDRHYSLTRVRDLVSPGGEGTFDVVVMRGEVSAVLRAAKISRADRTLLLKNADLSARRGWRPMAIASAVVGADDRVGEFVVHGFVCVRQASVVDIAAASDQWARVNVWSAGLRLQHWANVALIFLLSISGYYIMDPFFGPVATDHPEQAGYLMGIFRFIHITSGFLWLGLGLTRLILAFTSRDPYLRWPTLWPLKTKADVKHLGEIIGFYAFLRKEEPTYLAHNPLQQLAYTGLYVAGFVQMITGLTLYATYHQNNWFWQLMATPEHWFGMGPIRLFHAMVMFGMWAFVVMHVYLAIRADSLDRSGGISAMFNGGVWVRRGTKPVDAPRIR